MLFRCMMIALLLILSVMPVWAGEKDLTDQEIQNDITSNALYHISLERINAEQSPLSKIQTDMKLQRKGDTYYLHYTFTNPTGTHIEKTLRYADVFYSIKYADRSPNLSTQRCKTPTTFFLPPHKSTTVTLTLTHKEPFVYLSPSVTTFYFTDDSLKITPLDEAPLAIMKPIISPDGRLFLSVENTSPTETIKEIRDCYLFARFVQRDKKRTEWIYQNDRLLTMSLDLKPKSTVFIPLQPSFIYADWSSQKTRSDWVPMPNMTTIPPNSDLFVFHIDAQIDNTPHEFRDPIFEQDPIGKSHPSYNTYYHSPSHNAWYKVPHTVDITQWNEIEDNDLRIYYHIVNPYDIAIPMNNTIGEYFLSYVTKDARIKNHWYKYDLPSKTILSPKGELRFSFFVPLPDDFLAIDRSKIDFYKVNIRLGDAIAKTSDIPLTSLRKVFFTDLGEATRDKKFDLFD